jgi:hypothetical protein
MVSTIIFSKLVSRVAAVMLRDGRGEKQTCLQNLGLSGPFTLFTITNIEPFKTNYLLTSQMLYPRTGSKIRDFPD